MNYTIKPLPGQVSPNKNASELEYGTVFIHGDEYWIICWVPQSQSQYYKAIFKLDDMSSGNWITPMYNPVIEGDNILGKISAGGIKDALILAKARNCKINPNDFPDGTVFKNEVYGNILKTFAGGVSLDNPHHTWTTKSFEAMVLTAVLGKLVKDE